MFDGEGVLAMRKQIHELGNQRRRVRAKRIGYVSLRGRLVSHICKNCWIRFPFLLRYSE